MRQSQRSQSRPPQRGRYDYENEREQESRGYQGSRSGSREFGQESGRGQTYGPEFEEERYGGGQQGYSEQWNRPEYGQQSQSQRPYGQEYGAGQRGQQFGQQRGQQFGQQRGQQFGEQQGQQPYGGYQGQGERGELQRQRQGPKGYTRSDERIKEAICERLTETHWLDVSEVSVSVKDGEVTLEGTVPDRRMKHEVEDVADSCWGVREVENHLRISHQEEQGGRSMMGQSGSSQPGMGLSGTSQSGSGQFGASQSGSSESGSSQSGMSQSGMSSQQRKS